MNPGESSEVHKQTQIWLNLWTSWRPVWIVIKYFKQVRKLKVGKKTFNNNIDGWSESDDIANIFSGQYSILFSF